jgi:hypothetical protein
VQGRGDIASKLQGFPFRTDYNKLATLSRRTLPPPLALVTQHANKEPWFRCALYSEATISRGSIHFPIRKIR